MMTLQRSLTWLLLATSVVALTACGSRAPSRMTYAAATPLTDLNLLRDEIPEVLLKAQKKPYATPEDQSCGARRCKCTCWTRCWALTWTRPQPMPTPAWWSGAPMQPRTRP